MMPVTDTASSAVSTPQPSAILGVIVNPIAGLGGAVALHGSDGASARRALDLGGRRIATARTIRALRQLSRSVCPAAILVPRGAMGHDAVIAAGMQAEIISLPPEETTAEHTREAAAAMLDRADLILFAGGDGTARDIADTVGTAVPVIGVPTGVKMHSAVFGTTPEASGDIAAAYLRGDAGMRLDDRDVVELTNAGATAEAFHSVLKVPVGRRGLQGTKAVSAPDDGSVLDMLAARIAADLNPQHVTLFGPGTTTGRIMKSLGLVPTLAGTDVVLNARVVQRNATERQLIDWVSGRERVVLYLGVVGGQGFVLGRGNQPLSAKVIRLIGEDNVTILAGSSKILGLHPPVLFVDTGDDEAEPVLLGYRRVLTGPGTSVMVRVVNSIDQLSGTRR